MEEKKQEFYAVREHDRSRYDKRLILKIVGEVEAGLPRKEAIRIYNLGKIPLTAGFQSTVRLFTARPGGGNVIPACRSALLLRQSNRAG